MIAEPASPWARISRRIDRLSDRRFALLLFIPSAVLIAIFVLPPILAVLGMSAWRIELIRPGPTMFVGINNIGRMGADPDLLSAIPRTTIFALAATALSLPLALAAALLLNRSNRSIAILGVALLLPWAIAPIVTGFFWRFIFHPSFGIATNLAHALGLADGPIAWLQDSQSAMAIAVIATAWRSVPLLSLILLAALKTIPASQYRAARMDGASTWDAFRHITLPNLRNHLLVVAVLQVIVSLQVFDILFQLTRGGPGRETTTLTYYIYDAAFGRLSLGYASALGVLLMLIIIACSAGLLLVRLRSRRGQAGDAAGRAESAPIRAASFEHLQTARIARLAAMQELHAGAAPSRRRRGIPRRLARALLWIGAGLLVVWSVGPTLWILIASVQPESAVTSVPMALTPNLTFDRFGELLGDARWQSAIVVSLVVSVATTVITLVIGAMAAYPIARLELPGKGILLMALILTQMVPAIVLAIPLMLIFETVGLRDTVPGLIVANVAWSIPLGIWLLRNVFEEIPRSLDAAARMDGCSRLGTLFRIMIPTARPGLAATAILLLIGTWNEFLFAVILGNQGAVTVTRQIGFIDATGPTGVPPYTLQAAAGVVAAIPAVLLVAFFYRRIVAGVSEGFVKG